MRHGLLIAAMLLAVTATAASAENAAPSLENMSF